MREAPATDTEKFPCGCLITTGPCQPGQRKILFANAYFVDRLGFGDGALVGRTLTSLLTPASCIIFDSFMLPMLKHEGKVEETLLEILTPQHGHVPVVVNAVMDQPGDGYVYWSLFRAVQRNRLYNELNKARDMAEQASRAKSRFLSSMSHELRTPMNAILGFSQNMETDPALPDRHRSQVAEIIKAGNHLLELINDVLDLARVEAGQIDLALENVEVNKAIEDVLGLVKPLSEHSDIKCQMTSPESLWVRADRTRLKQALLNLVSNAIKYNRKGGRVYVAIERVRDDGQPRVRIAVTDTGPGIAPEELPGLTSPFNRLPQAGSHIEGTGIGLTITRQIIDAMDGNLGISSEVGVGSTFWIELPECPPDTRAVAPPAGKPAEETPPPEPRPCTVLYIEDNPVNLKVVELFIRRHGKAQMVPAESPEKGIELATTLKPDLVLLDISMPRMDGYQVLKVLREKPELSDTPIIAMTGFALPEEIERGKAAGFDDYLTKPIKMTQFFEVLDQYLAQQS